MRNKLFSRTALVIMTALALVLTSVGTSIAQEPSPLAPAAPEGAVIYVSLSGSCGSGGILIPCFNNLQAAVDAASDSDIIKVAAGTYTGVTTRSDETQVVFVDKSVTIRGGYAEQFNEPPDALANPTVVDAEQQGRGFWVVNSDPTIENLTITGGLVTDRSGGGVYLNHSNGTLRNNLVTGNTAVRGGGLCLFYSDATLEGNTITGNNAVENNAGSGGGGGGLYLNSSYVTLDGNSITGNSAKIGGGMYFAYSPPGGFVSNVVTSNAATIRGGGVSLWGTNITTCLEQVVNNDSDVDPDWNVDLGSSLEPSPSCPTAALAVTLDGPAKVEAGGSYSITITISNTDGSDATGLVVTTTLPLSVTVVGSVDSGTLAFPEWVVTTATLPAGGVLTYTIVVIAPTQVGVVLTTTGRVSAGGVPVVDAVPAVTTVGAAQQHSIFLPLVLRGR